MGDSTEIKVIILDNNLQMMNMIQENIEDENLKVVEKFDDVENALNFVKNNSVDVIISDIVLPKEDGFSFLNKLNLLNLEKTPKAIILSALSNDNFISKALSMGASY